MDENDPVLVIIDALHQLNVPFMLVGSYSSNLHGIPRSTEDADFVLELGDTSISELAQHVMAEFKLDPQMGFETVTGHSRWHFIHRASKFKVELFLLVGDEFDQGRFRRRVHRKFHGRDIWYQSAEDVIVNKLRWARSKDTEDVIAVMKMRWSQLDWEYIERWCKEFRRTHLLAKMRQRVQSPASMDDADSDDPPAPPTP